MAHLGRKQLGSSAISSLFEEEKEFVSIGGLTMKFTKSS